VIELRSVVTSTTPKDNILPTASSRKHNVSVLRPSVRQSVCLWALGAYST